MAAISGPVAGLIQQLQQAHGECFTPDAFIDNACALLQGAKVDVSDLAAFLAGAWDPVSCLPHPVDTDAPPFLVDLHALPDWCLRATIWASANLTEWRDVPHSHFGHIATTALSRIAYTARTYKSFVDVAHGLYEDTPLLPATVHRIRPETIHEVILPPEGIGVSLSVRSRSVTAESREYDRSSGSVRTRTKSATDRKTIVLRWLEGGL